MSLPAIITLTTDFGVDSPYVAVMKGVILTLQPAARIVDLTHSIRPQDVRQAALILAEVCERFPAGTIHVAVVDPGVGTERRLVYAEIRGQRYIGPDNGLFGRIASQVRPTLIVTLANQKYWLSPVSDTFHGRDILSPVAAQLSLGVEPREFGPEQEGLVLLDWPQPIVTGRQIVGQIQAIDSFGNAITNITQQDLANVENRTSAVIHCGAVRAEGIFRTYGLCQAGSVIGLMGSSGYLELAVVNGSAACELNLAVGAKVVVDW